MVCPSHQSYWIQPLRYLWSLHFNQTFWWNMISKTFWKLSNLTFFRWIEAINWFTFSSFDCLRATKKMWHTVPVYIIYIILAPLHRDNFGRSAGSRGCSRFTMPPFFIAPLILVISPWEMDQVEAEPPTHPVSRVWRKGHCVLSEDSNRQVGVWKTDEIQAKRLRI